MNSCVPKMLYTDNMFKMFFIMFSEVFYKVSQTVYEFF